MGQYAGVEDAVGYGASLHDMDISCEMFRLAPMEGED